LKYSNILIKSTRIKENIQDDELYLKIPRYYILVVILFLKGSTTGKDRWDQVLNTLFTPTSIIVTVCSLSSYIGYRFINYMEVLWHDTWFSEKLSGSLYARQIMTQMVWKKLCLELESIDNRLQ